MFRRLASSVLMAVTANPTVSSSVSLVLPLTVTSLRFSTFSSRVKSILISLLLSVTSMIFERELYPTNETIILVLPIGILLIEYIPLSSVKTPRLKPCIETLANDKGIPEVSLTVPEIVLRVSCPLTVM